MFTIWKRDLLGYFRTPIGYAFSGVFLSLAGLIFYLFNIRYLTSDILAYMNQLTTLLMLLSPLLTMRLLSEERQKKTDQLLFTSPISLTKIVVGKYLAASTVLFITLLLSQAYMLVIASYGRLYLGEWLAGYIGFFMQGLSFLALDLLVSSFAKNQITGAVAAFGANFFLWMIDMLSTSATGIVADIISFLSLYSRYQPFVLGQLSISSLFYYLCFIIACLLITIRILDARRFNQGGAA